MIATLEEQRATTLYHEAQFGLDAAKLMPGEYYATDRPMVLVTLLGSCVAACLRDAELGLGGMNHFMLPESVHEPGSPLSSSARYGTCAMELLINELVRLGARRNRLQAKVFGGGNVLPGLGATNVGERNAAFVLHYLKTEGIPVLAQDLVNIYPRKVYFFPEDGRVMVRKLRSAHQGSIRRSEGDYRRRLAAAKWPAPAGGPAGSMKPTCAGDFS
jgi:chemotaxis protein CheD